MLLLMLKKDTMQILEKNIIILTGFGFSDVIDDRTIENLVNFLKKEINSATVFLFVFKGAEKRFTRTAVDWLNVMINLFGRKLWDHVILEVRFIYLK